MIKANINNSPLQAKEVPNFFVRPNGTKISNYKKCTEFHFDDGFRDIVTPEFDNKTQKLGKLIIDGDTVTYIVLDYTPESERILSKQERIANAYTNFYEPQGAIAYNNFRASVIEDIYTGEITQSQAIQIEKVLSCGFNLIKVSGNWVGGLDELQKLENIEGFVQPYYDKAIILFSDYVELNFNTVI